MPRIAFHVDILCLGHSRPAIIERRYFARMSQVMELFDDFGNISKSYAECIWHRHTMLIPRFIGPISYEATGPAGVEDSNVNAMSR